MTSDAYPVQWTGRQAVVALPEHIGLSNAGLIREELLSVINRGATALIADMTATISCDHAGADAVARAFQRAVISGTELRLVVTAQIVRRVLGINGLDRLVSIYPSLETATAARPPAPALASVAESARAGTNGNAPPRRPAAQEGQRPSCRQRPAGNGTAASTGGLRGARPGRGRCTAAPGRGWSGSSRPPRPQIIVDHFRKSIASFWLRT